MQNLANYSLEQLFRKCLKAVNEIMGETSEKSAEKYLQEMGFFNKDTTYLNAVYGIMDMTDLSFKYITNTEISLGIPVEAFMQKGFSQFLSSMTPEKENVSSIPTLFKFMIDSIKEAPQEIKKNFIAYGYGMKHFRPSGIPFHTMVQIFGLEFNENGYPTLCFIVDQDIDHLIKPTDQYWGRMSFNNAEFVTAFSSKEMSLKKQDIFSAREIEVLKLLMKGYESKQIAEKLFISSNTVDNHRKNMIRKLDARDTTALVQLTKQLGILR
ncbi:MAG: helix-turn-helix transcriptional regulator [Arcicella sp.]|nr:helix-turn-helix transcriptional regulator [Arcicella sp.]